MVVLDNYVPITNLLVVIVLVIIEVIAIGIVIDRIFIWASSVVASKNQ